MCVQLEPSGVIRGHLEMCRGTLCTCTISCFICCIAVIDAKHTVYLTGLLITQDSNILKSL